MQRLLSAYERAASTIESVSCFYLIVTALSLSPYGFIRVSCVLYIAEDFPVLGCSKIERPIGFDGVREEREGVDGE